jgi:tetratricopeptide (TPR) repeat protein
VQPGSIVCSVTVIVGGSRAARDAAVAERVGAHGAAPVHQADPRRWPFLRHLDTPSTSAPVVIVARGVDAAFPDAQSGGTRLVLTQSTYVMQRWLDWIDAHGRAALIADAPEPSLQRHAPEAAGRRGPWSRIERLDLPASQEDDRGAHLEPIGEPLDTLAAAFRTVDPAERVARCRGAAGAHPQDPAVHLALGSALMEVRDFDASQQAIDRSLALAPDWEAAHYELGKLLMRRDDLEGASRAFAEAARLMPTFSAALSNLGAALGELDRRDEALEALRRALQHDPHGFPILNNVGVASRELGRLRDAEAAFRQVVTLAPDFVFGHYNLGHTLFLQGRYQASLAAYAEGQRRDPERNPRQASRLAVVRLAAGDPEGAVRDLQRAAGAAPRDQRQEILSEAQEILWALLTDRPHLPGWKQMADVVKRELDRI